MKTKHQLTILVLIGGLMVTSIVYGDDPIKGTANDSTSGKNMGWQEKTSRQTIYISDGLRLGAGVGVGLTGPNLNVNLGTNLFKIECCQPATLPQFWCNYNADDERCAN
jgi:hypothetical protein